MPIDPPPLSPLHRDLLAAAARRSDHRLAPPERVLGGARKRLGEKLVALGVAEVVTGDAAPVWGHTPSGEATGLKLTAAGLAIAGVGEGADGSDFAGSEGPGERDRASSAPVEPRGWTKIARVLALLRRAEGADLDTLAAATDWLPHTTRAALTGLRRKGHAIEARKREADGRTVYRIVASSTAAAEPEPGTEAASEAASTAAEAGSTAPSTRR